MAGADPAFLAGSFATDYPASSSQQGERGAFMYFEGGYWDISMDGGPAFQLTPYGSRIIQANGSAQDGPAMTSPPRRPPWSLVLPRHSTFLGRPEDCWQLDAGWPATVDADSWIVPLRGLEAPGFKGTLTVDATMFVHDPGPAWPGSADTQNRPNRPRPRGPGGTGIPEVHRQAQPCLTSHDGLGVGLPAA